MNGSLVRSRLAAAWLAVIATALAGCGSSDSTPDGGGGTGGSGGAAGYKPCALPSRVGSFTIELGNGFTQADGTFTDGVVPQSIPDEVSKTGECRFLRPRRLFCDPECASGQNCNTDKKCIPHPADKNVGALTITGLKTSPITVMPNSSNYYNAPGTLPHPGFDDSSMVVLQAAGGVYQPFTLRASGFPAIAVTSTNIVVDRNKPVMVAWTAPAKAGTARVLLELRLDNHGATRANVLCDVADSGTYTIPAAVVNQLLDTGLSGFPTLTVKRISADSTMITPGCVELTLESGIDLDISVVGLTSCNDTKPCPAGQMCQRDLRCQ